MTNELELRFFLRALREADPDFGEERIPAETTAS